ncbi:riboflavin kinase/FMN adenylyltransferase [Allostreptomyces psammosilenae]|uniref:Riboflavin biosynthesis protein n=1 Tax=Allostreptomyces psammosilenae TaxID=1892865 RepID=A0A853A231_9ACTN|nr:riboflavin kinase/FMN adenylyltransferase [Allostreptomyces psammosilenae]
MDDVPGDWGRSVVTIGSYDGVHRGHQLILARAFRHARELDLPIVLVTFDPHPAEVVRPGAHPALLTPHHRRGELLEAMGVDALLILPFTREFSELHPADFVRQVLVDGLHAKVVVEGPNFRYGHQAAGDVELLAGLGLRYDFTVDVVDLFTDGTREIVGDGTGSEVISSSRIRRLIAEGDVTQARELLGRPHRVEGVVVRGAQRGRDMGYPTANVETLPHTAVPADGVYSGWLIADGERMPAAISIGTNPTFDNERRTVEAYAIDRTDLDLYGKHVAVEFSSYLRGMERFASVPELLERMADDVDRARAELAATPGGGGEAAPTLA